MRHRLQWFIQLQAHGLRKGDEHPAYTAHCLVHFLRLLAVLARRAKCMRQPRSCLQLSQRFTDFYFFQSETHQYTFLNSVINNPTTP